MGSLICLVEHVPTHRRLPGSDQDTEADDASTDIPSNWITQMIRPEHVGKTLYINTETKQLAWEKPDVNVIDWEQAIMNGDQATNRMCLDNAKYIGKKEFIDRAYAYAREHYKRDP